MLFVRNTGGGKFSLYKTRSVGDPELVESGCTREQVRAYVVSRAVVRALDAVEAMFEIDRAGGLAN